MKVYAIPSCFLRLSLSPYFSQLIRIRNEGCYVCGKETQITLELSKACFSDYLFFINAAELPPAKRFEANMRMF